MIVKLAWRNIWRNPQRSALTLSSLVIALCCSLLMQAQQEGTYQHIVQEGVKNHLGHLQIHYSQDSAVPQSSHFLSENLVNDLAQNKIFSEDVFIPRVASQAIVFGKAQSYQNVVLWGVHTIREDALSQVHKHLISGGYFESSSEKSILIGEQLAHKLRCRVGEELILQTQTVVGMQIKKAYLVKGIFRLPSKTFNKRLIYLPLKTAQDLLNLPNRLSYCALVLKEPASVTLKKSMLEKLLTTQNLRISTWKEEQPELAQVIQAQALGAKLMMGILYLVVGFGFFTNTILLLHEREAERQLLLSLGMARYQIGFTLALELFFLGLVGLALGNILSLPLLNYLSNHPIELRGVISESVQSLGLLPRLHYSFTLQLFFLPNLYLLLMLVCLCAFPFYRVYVERSE